ncbi:recombinase family protein [Streptomyces collinus]|uniref:recombinase family protein n=1 Tax=Streptomyces collinus TaxID=42684 RepID=UPI0037A0137C
MPFAPEYLHLVFPGVRFDALLYGRNSDDPLKMGGSVEDQLTTGRTLCHNHDWHIQREFKDTDVSASRHGKKARDDFEELLSTITGNPAPAGVRRILVAYNASRYYRDLEAYVRLRNACLAANVLLCYNGQVYDLSRRDDRKATAMHAVDAEDEAEGLRDQNLRTATLQAEAGKPHGKLLYGYLREYAVVGGRKRCVRQYEDPVRDTYVFQSLQRIDTGHSMRSLVRWLRSVPEAARPDGKPWNEITARRMLLNRAYLGERVHKGTWVKGTWDPIKGLETPEGRAMFNRVTLKLTDPARRTQRGTEVAHLLSFNSYCGECGDHRVLAAWPRASGTMLLGCKETRHLAIREDLADAYVEEAVIQWFRDKRKATTALVPDEGEVEEKVTSAQRRINAYEEQLREAREQAEEFDEESGRFKLSATSLASIEQRLVPKLEQERKKLQQMTGVSPLLLTLLEAKDPDAVWNGLVDADGRVVEPGLSLEQKREVIRKVVTMRLHRASRPGIRGVEPGRITLAFVGQPGFRDGPLRGPVSVPAQGLQGVPAPGGPSGTG